MTVRRYVKRPVQVEAMQFDGGNLDELRAFAGPTVQIYNEKLTNVAPMISIHTLEGVMNVTPGDWIIRGVKGEFYPCKPDIFDASYMLVIEETDTRVDATVVVDSIGAGAHLPLPEGGLEIASSDPDDPIFDR